MEFADAGRRLVAGCVTACRSLRGGSEQYERPLGQLRDRADALLRLLADGPTLDANALELANDRLLRQLDADEAPLPEPPQPLVESRRPKIARPQLSFKILVDNSHSPWKPKTTRQLAPEYDENGVVVGYENPYGSEIEDYTPPPELLIDYDDDNTIQPPRDKSLTPFKLVKTSRDLEALVQHLKTVDEVAVDVEHHSYRTFMGMTCLVQLSTDSGGDFVVDALALRDKLVELNGCFLDPKVLKVFHGATSDIIWLQRDLGIYVVGMFDTHEAALRLKLPHRSLQYLLKEYCNETVDKTLQLADWRLRPLTYEMLEYARSDTHSLLYIWRRMRKELLERGGENLLKEVFKSSNLLCLSTYRKPILSDDYCINLIAKSRKTFNTRQEAALKSICKWRDEVARNEDESTGYVLPNHMMLEIAHNLPKETSGILACCVPTPPLLLHHLIAVHKLILQALSIPMENLLRLTPNTVEANVSRPSFHLMVYDRQTKPTKFEGICLPDTNIDTKPHKKSLMASTISDAESKICDKMRILCNINTSFCSPFERCVLVKKYNETIAKQMKDTPVDNHNEARNVQNPPEINTANSEEASTTLESRLSPDITTIPIEEPPKKKRKTENGGPEHIHKYRKPKFQKPFQHQDSPDTSFKPFDYKQFDYNIYNKNPQKKNKNKNKFKNKNMPRNKNKTEKW